LADLIEGVAGEWSLFEEQHGFSIDGVDLTTVVLPEGAARVHRLVFGVAGPLRGNIVRRTREGPEFRGRLD
jgi:hypothetical protein